MIETHGSYVLRGKADEEWRSVDIYTNGIKSSFELGEPVHLGAPMVRYYLDCSFKNEKVWWLFRIYNMDGATYASLSRVRDSNKEDLRCCVTALRKIPAMLRIAIEAS